MGYLASLMHSKMNFVFTKEAWNQQLRSVEFLLTEIGPPETNLGRFVRQTQFFGIWVIKREREKNCQNLKYY
jgi:hypothetical protein